MVEYKFFNKYIFRAPLKAYSENNLSTINYSEVEKVFKSEKLFREAVFLASKDLFEEAEKQLLKGSLNEKTANSLLKYYLRMHTRCTPFGLFAGSSGLGTIERADSSIILCDISQYEKQTRFDMEIIYNISRYLTSIDDIRRNISFQPNNTICQIGNEIRYIETTTQNNKRTYFSVSIKNSDYLQDILSFCEQGASISDAVHLLIDKGFEEEESIEYVNDLIDNQILVSELSPSSINNSPLEFLIDILKKKCGNSDKTNNIIKYLNKFLEELKTRNIYRNDIITSGSFDKSLFQCDSIKHTLQTDLYLPTQSNTLSKESFKVLLDGVNVISKLFFSEPSSDLERFKSIFYEKYEQREVPLLRVLDSETGIGSIFGKAKHLLSPIIDDLIFTYPENNNRTVEWTKTNSLLTNKLSKFFNSDKSEIEITDSDIENLNVDDKKMPETISSIVEIYNENGKEYFFLSGLSSAAGNLMGRFSSLDSNIEDFIKEDILKKEQESFDEDIIFAEISHFPEARIGNILLRPSFSEYEIPFIASSTLPQDKQLMLNDLYISIKNNEIVLTSKKYNKRVIPKLTTAHNYFMNMNLPIYRFMCELYHQNKRKIFAFSWNALEQSYSYLPRVRYKNIILSKARWLVQKRDIEFLYRLSDAELIHAIAQWRKINSIPSKVALRDFDNKLYIDFNNLLLVKLLLTSVSNRNQFEIEEILFTEENLIIENEAEEKFISEFIVSFYKKK